MAPPSLLNIPLELRFKIFRYCMVVGVVTITTSSFSFRSASAHILRTSKQLHNEALPILYGENIFYFADGSVMESDLLCINNDAKSMIRHVFLGNPASLTTKRAVLKSLTGLRGFSIFTTTAQLLVDSEPEANKKMAVEKMPPKTVVQGLSTKSRGVEVAVVFCFVSDVQDLLPPGLDLEAMARFRVRLPGKGAEKKGMTLELDFEGWRDYKALIPNNVARK